MIARIQWIGLLLALVFITAGCESIRSTFSSAKTPGSGAYRVDASTLDQKPLEIARGGRRHATVFVGDVNADMLLQQHEIVLNTNLIINNARSRISASLTRAGFVETLNVDRAEYRVDPVVQKVTWFAGDGSDYFSVSDLAFGGNTKTTTEGTWIEAEISLRFVHLETDEVFTFDGRGVESRESTGVLTRARYETTSGSADSEWRMEPADENVVPEALRFAALSAAANAAEILNAYASSNPAQADADAP